MPVKRRTAKRRIDLTTLLDAWESPFETGADFFRELPSIGVPVNENGAFDRQHALEAWLLLGPTFCANRNPALRESWAEREFGRFWEVQDNAG